uniref:Uncharacterized protein n=1 Tax=Candidatus Kentrum eta TaxID=2126337 RepID=A0A450VWL5_9GAMM|nr:MAG: hypothetical protein BECKH772B_GA0070898_105651 [Candidatus Kentron sp. H]VFK06181.1 MAG: hypothetical protein BECKH772A_GA0070896_106201 [Candidatus Kentron sp. H]VFK09177.1 MAG: hypothetical protein BECKH772C_GA0070978_105841 [Candidatus Kentron sp. H]
MNHNRENIVQMPDTQRFGGTGGDEFNEFFERGHPAGRKCQLPKVNISDKGRYRETRQRHQREDIERHEGSQGNRMKVFLY